MGEVVSLRRARKVKAREAEAAQAAENRRRHGQTKAERERARQEHDSLDRTLDAARLDKNPE